MPDGMTKCRMCGKSVLQAQPEPSMLDRPILGTVKQTSHTPAFSKWLFLVGLSLVLTPALYLYTIFSRDLVLLTTDEGLAEIGKYPGSDKLVEFELIASIVLVLAAVVVNFLFYRKSKRFPVSMMIYVGTIFAYRVAYTGVMHVLFPQMNLAGNFYPLVRSMAYAGLAIWYLFTAKEVKERFVK
jgi:hypothetical protein